MSTIDDIIASYDPAKIIHQIAGLSLGPQNQNFAIRLEFLAQQIAAHSSVPTKPDASKGALRNLLTELENSHWQVCAYEDPVIGYYVSEYYLDERIYLFFVGNTLSLQYQFKSFSRSTESLDDYVKQVLGFTPQVALHVILAINTLIAQRISAPLYASIPQKKPRPEIPSSTELSEFMDALVVTIDEIVPLTPGIDSKTAKLVIEKITGKQGEYYSGQEFNPDNHPVARRPCIDIGVDQYLVTFPSLLFAAMRKVVYDAIRQSEEATGILDNDFRKAVVNDVALNLRNIHRVYDPVYVCLEPTLNDKQVADIAVFLDRDKVMLVSIASASLSNCSDGVWTCTNVSDQVKDAYSNLLENQETLTDESEMACIMLRDIPQPVLIKVPQHVEFLKLVVAISPNCSTLAGFNPADDNSWLALPTDIEVICTGVEYAQDFIKFLRGVQNLHRKYNKINAYLLSDIFGMYIDTGRTFYQNIGMLNFMSIDPSWGAEIAFDQEKKTKWFRLSEHGAPIRGERIDGNRYGIVAEDRSWGAHAVDIIDLHALFFFEPPVERADFPGISVFVADLLSYYFPAIVKAIPDIDLTKLPGYALVCRIVTFPSEIDENAGKAGSLSEESDTPITFRSGRTQPHDNYTIEIKARANLYSTFAYGSNNGERLVVRTFLHALSRAVGSYLGVSLDIDAVLDIVVPESTIRNFTVSSIEPNIQTIDLGYGTSFSIHPYDESRLLDEVAELVNKEGLIERYPPLKTVELILTKAVAQFFTRLETEVKSVAGPDFARFVYDQLESTLYYRVHKTWEVVSVEGKFDEFNPLKSMEEHFKDIGKKLSAQRFLLEMIACYQSDGNPPFSVERYLEILAICNVITNLGGIIDDIHFGLSIERVELLESKRFEFYRKDNGQPYDLLMQVQVAQNYDVARKIFSRLTRPDADKSVDTNEHEVLKKVDQAFTSEYGYSAQQLFNTLIELSKFSVEQSEVSTLLTCDQAISVIEKGNGTPAEVCKRILESRSLYKREKLISGVQWSEVQPWRSYRQLSLINKPFIRICNGGSDNILFGPKMLMLTVSQILDRAASGLLSGNTKQFKKIMSQLANRAGRKLEDETYVHLAALGWKARSRIKRKITGVNGESFWGEVDVLAWKPDKRILIVMECKDLQKALNPYAFAEELRKFYEEGSEESFVPKLQRKVSWFKENLSAVLPQLGEETVKIGKWRVKGMIITDDAHLSAYIGQSDYHIIPLDRLTNDDLLC